MDWMLQQKIDRAIQSAITDMETKCGDTCLVCHSKRELFPGVIHLFQKEDGKLEGKVATVEDWKGTRGWMEFVVLGSTQDGPKFSMCTRCAIIKGLIPDPDACKACDDEVGGIGRCEKHNPTPKVEPAPVEAKAEEPF